MTVCGLGKLKRHTSQGKAEKAGGIYTYILRPIKKIDGAS